MVQGLIPVVSLSYFSTKISLHHKEEVNQVVNPEINDGCSSCLLPTKKNWIPSTCDFGKERASCPVNVLSALPRGRWHFYFPFHLHRTSCEELFPAPAKKHFDRKPGTSHIQENTIFFPLLFHTKDFSNHVVSLSLLAALVWSGLEALRYSTSVERWMSSAERRMDGCECKDLTGQCHCLGELVTRWKSHREKKVFSSFSIGCTESQMRNTVFTISHLVFHVCYSFTH